MQHRLFPSSRTALFVLYTLLSICFFNAYAKVIGATEVVTIDHTHQQCARIDTGAALSSLHVDKLWTSHDAQGEWAHFFHHGTSYKKKIKRYTTVTQQAGTSTRPVVIMHLTMPNIDGTYAFSLANRSHLNYPVLIGRNVLDTPGSDLRVDVSKNTTCKP